MEMLTALELAKKWQVTPKWVANHTRSPKDPIPHVRLGRYVRFEDGEQLRAWLQRRQVNYGK